MEILYVTDESLLSGRVFISINNEVIKNRLDCKFKVLTIHQLPLLNEQFDLVIASPSLEEKLSEIKKYTKNMPLMIINRMHHKTFNGEAILKSILEYYGGSSD